MKEEPFQAVTINNLSMQDFSLSMEMATEAMYKFGAAVKAHPEFAWLDEAAEDPWLASGIVRTAAADPEPVVAPVEPGRRLISFDED